MAQVLAKNITKRFDDVVAVRNLTLEVRNQEFVVLLGPSGCGKTTTLRCIAGLEYPQEGDIYIDGERVNHLTPADRDIAFVFQSFALYPHMSVWDNLAFPLRAVRTARPVIEERIREVAAVLHIERLLNRKPGKLSGGEMQRVALGRAMVRRPKVFLMDEPLTNLDAKLRAEMRAELKRLQNDIGATTLYVTHDQLEAMSMGDRIAVMLDGELQQLGTPTEVYDRPRNLFVAGFIGTPAMNTARCRLTPDGGTLELSEGLAISLAAGARDRLDGPSGGQELILGVRAEDISLSREAKDGFLPAEVYVLEPLGSENIVDLRLAGQVMKARTVPTFTAGIGERLWMRIDQKRMHLFDAETGEALF